MNNFAEPGAVEFGAIGEAAFWAEITGLKDQIQEEKISAFDDGNIDGKAG